MVLKILKAVYVGDYKIKLKFSNRRVRLINFEPFLSQAKNPMTRKYLDKDEFKKFKLEYGDLQWNDHELCFPIMDLYEDNISISENIYSVA